jgi:hypothetical protein
MQVTNVVEHEDGSATFTFAMTSEESRALLTFGIVTAIQNGIQEATQYADDQHA